MAEKILNSDLWHACAGGMVQMPPVNSKVFYFPQGHAEHAFTTVNFNNLPQIPAMILCRVTAVKFHADKDSDEVYAKIKLLPIAQNDIVSEHDDVFSKPENSDHIKSFAKTLTQSDANNGGGFSVPRYCAETIFPRLDYTADPPVQKLFARDVHGEEFDFRHIYRGTPRRHLLTTGWSTFVNKKKLVAGDSIVFLRSENDELFVGIRRAKRGNAVNNSGIWNSGSAVGNYERFKELFGGGVNGGEENRVKEKGGKVSSESVVEAAFLASNGREFEVVFYPRAGTPEFCVKYELVGPAMRVRWGPGIRFKMAFETEDSSRISWFMGTVAAVQVAEPVAWPNSPWRSLQVTWDEPDLLQNVKCVSPWLVEIVSNMPPILSPFSPSRKKLRLAPNQPEFPIDLQFHAPLFTGIPQNYPFYTNNFSAGIQGARHAQIGVPLSDLHLRNNLQTGMFSRGENVISRNYKGSNENENENENVSCVLSMGNSTPENNENVRPSFILFGQPILTEQQISGNRAELGLEKGECKVFLDSDDVGRNLDLSVLGNYEELFKKLESMFEIEKSEIMNRVIYWDENGAAKRAGDEPFSEFVKTAKRLSILVKPGSNGAERKLITGLPTGERGLDSSNQAGSFSIFA